MTKCPITIYKFGGAALRDSRCIRRVLEIIKRVPADHTLVVVVSALGKTTNALESALDAARQAPERLAEIWEPIHDTHIQIVREVLGPQSAGTRDTHALLQAARLTLESIPGQSYDAEYDAVIPFGELLSSLILSHAIVGQHALSEWVSIQTVLKSDSVHRAATVLQHPSLELCRQAFKPVPGKIYITQGFIASDLQSATTTLGREGSDYTAALLGQFLQAHGVTIWKDVPGFLTADPKLFRNARLIDQLSYHEAIEMANAGAKIVHPKAIKPLQNAGIPLRIRPFDAPESKGTTIMDQPAHPIDTPLIALRDRQTLLSITPDDLSFAVRDSLGPIFTILQAHHVQINLIQTSAVSLSICLDSDPVRLPQAIQALQHAGYRITFNENLTLLAIRHHTQRLRDPFTRGDGVLASQITRASAQYIIRTHDWEAQYLPLINRLL